MSSAARSLNALLRIPQLWGAALLLCAALMLVGWSKSYPVPIAPENDSVFTVVSGIFWVGLWGSFCAIVGLVMSSRSQCVHWIATLAFVVLLSSPQFLYLSWGSDAGVLADMVRYSGSVAQFDMSRDGLISSYFQWPLSIFFSRLIGETLGTDPYTAVQVGFLLVAVAVGGGLFALWHGKEGKTVTSSQSAFWAVATYFVGFYWLLNWQAVPYAFSLVFLFPILALLDGPTLGDKLLLLLLFVAGIESHALVGVWTILILVLTVCIQYVRQKRTTSLNLALLFLVAQVGVVIYKNVRFFRYAILGLQGYYRSLLDHGGSDRAMIRDALRALSPLPSDLGARILKSLSWLDLGLVGLACVVAVWVVIKRRKLCEQEIVLATVGVAHFAFGTQFAAIGTRSLQLIALLPAACVGTSMALSGRSKRLILAAVSLGVLLFPAVLMRSHQAPTNLVAPAHVAIKAFLGQHRPDFPQPLVALDEGRITTMDQVAQVVLNPYTIQTAGCSGPFLMVDSPRLRSYITSAVGNPWSPEMTDRRFTELIDSLTTVYDNGALTLRLGQDCSQLAWLWDRTDAR